MHTQVVHKLLAVVVATALAAAVLTMAGPSSAAGTMSRRQAGRYYLTHACAVGQADDRFVRRIWRGRDIIPFAEVRRRLPELRHESRLYAEATHGFAHALRQPPGAWPRDVRLPVHSLADRYARIASFMDEMARAGTANRWVNLVNAMGRISLGRFPQVIRARLGLPPSGGCGGTGIFQRVAL